jgi:hypothetical protein
VIIFNCFCVLFVVQGTRQSQVEAKLVKDGKALPLKEVEIIVSDDKATFKFKKPVRNLSGAYQLKLSNSQGEDVRNIKINMQGYYFRNHVFSISKTLNDDCSVQMCQLFLLTSMSLMYSKLPAMCTGSHLRMMVVLLLCIM